MRTLLALAAVVGAGAAVLWFAFLDREGREKPPPAPDPLAQELAENPHLQIRTSTLVIRARAPDGSVPFGTEVGYLYRGKLRVLYAGEDGARRFTDAPVGDVVVVARAEGYQEVRQPRTLLAGVPAEVPLTLRPRRD